jgi:DNA-binding Xre family transcriptional regulator
MFAHRCSWARRRLQPAAGRLFAGVVPIRDTAIDRVKRELVPEDVLHRHVVAQIERLLTQRAWSGRKLAAESGVSHAQVARLLKLQQSPTLATLQLLADALDVKLRDLLPR